MNSRTESTTFETVAETMRPPQGDGWDYLVIAGIFASMFALAWAALATPLLQPLVAVARRQHGTMLGALAEGFRRATGEIIVTGDSDSVIERGALLTIAGPFRDRRVGAVAGKVAVHNRRAGLIPRMLHVRFILSFDYLRSAQSVFRT